jgi:hypothetical protein
MAGILLRKQLGKLQRQLTGVRSAAKVLRRFDHPRTEGRKETRVVRCWEREDCEGCEIALVEVSSASEEGSGIGSQASRSLVSSTNIDRSCHEKSRSVVRPPLTLAACRASAELRKAASRKAPLSSANATFALLPARNAEAAACRVSSRATGRWHWKRLGNCRCLQKASISGLSA